MLQFWKRNTRQIKNPSISKDQKANGGSLPVGVLLPTLSEFTLEGPLSHFEHDGYSTDTLPAQSSRLESNLSEILHDETALPHFFQFAEARGYSAILNLWGDLKQLIGLRPVLIDERTCPNQCASENPSPLPLTGKDLCHRYLTEDIIQRYRLPEALCLRVQEAFSKNASYDQECQQLQEFIYHMLKRELWHDFVRSEYYSKFQVEVLTGGNVTLSDILFHTTALKAFTEFLDQEGCQSVIEFWQTATIFQSQLEPDTDPTISQNEAINIYDKYLSMQASCPLGLDHPTRCEVEQRICVEDAAPRSDCFEPALRRAWGYLRYVCLPIFLSSQRYVQLISELMQTSRANSSPASSMTDLSVDSSHSRYDPDNIWRRRHHHRGLSIGRIDQLGRFETDIEPEPDKKSESRISRVVKKLVNKDEHKAQEEMAWRVAEMIVKDVTNLTMGGQAEEDNEEVT